MVGVSGSVRGRFFFADVLFACIRFVSCSRPTSDQRARERPSRGLVLENAIPYALIPMHYAFEMMFHIVKSIIGIERIYTPYGCGAPCRAALKCTVTCVNEIRKTINLQITKYN